jgi:alpha-glucosidase
VPFFIREGAVLPIYPVMQWTGEKPIEELTLYVYYKNGKETSTLYEDAGEGYDYQQDVYSLKRYETMGTETNFTLLQTMEGSYIPTYSSVKVYLVGFPTFLKRCTVDGHEMPIKEIRLRDRSLYTLVVTPRFETIEWNA